MLNWMPIATVTVLVPIMSWAALSAKVTSTGNYDPNHCGFWGDSETLTITNNSQQVLQKRYCSAYGKSTATVVTDARAKSYVLLKYTEGHGTNAWTDYLAIYRLTDRLTEQTHVMLSQGYALTSRWVYDYVIEKPGSGGLRIVMSLRLEGPPDARFLLPKQTQIVRIDAFPH